MSEDRRLEIRKENERQEREKQREREREEEGLKKERSVKLKGVALAKYKMSHSAANQSFWKDNKSHIHSFCERDPHSNIPLTAVTPYDKPCVRACVSVYHQQILVMCTMLFFFNTF